MTELPGERQETSEKFHLISHMASVPASLPWLLTCPQHSSQAWAGMGTPYGCLSCPERPGALSDLQVPICICGMGNCY